MALAIDRHRRVAALVAGTIVFVIVYWGAARLAWRPPVILAPTALDQQIPFARAAVWAYLSELPLVFLTLWLPGARCRARAFVAMAFTVLGAGLAFALFPVQIPRQPVDYSGATGMLWELLYALDVPGNALPSLHAAFALIALLVLWRAGSMWRRVASLWVFAILAAALLTKQHFLPDLSAGICLGIAAFLLAAKVVR